MIPSESPVYDLKVLARANWHIHTQCSPCASFEMAIPRILAQAEYADLRTIALVDHHHPKGHDILADIKRLKREIKAFQPTLRVIVGAELSAFGVGKYSDTDRQNRKIDYRLYACNHYHLEEWEHPATTSPRAYAEHGLAMIRELFKSRRADAIAHPFAAKYLLTRLDDPVCVTRAITDSELGELLDLGRQAGAAWELSPKSLLEDPEFARRYWNLGRETGVTFRLGTDAHALGEIDTGPFVERLRAILDSAR